VLDPPPASASTAYLYIVPRSVASWLLGDLPASSHFSWSGGLVSLRARLALVLAGVLAGPVVAAGLVVAVLVPRARADADDAALRRALAAASAYLEQRCTSLGDVARATALDLSGALTAGRPLDAGAAGDAARAALRDDPGGMLAVVDVVADGRLLASTASDGGADQAADAARLPALLLASCSRGVAPSAGAATGGSAGKAVGEVAQVESVPVTHPGGREAARVVAVGPLDGDALADLRGRLALSARLTLVSDGRPVAAGDGGTADEGGRDLAAAVAAAARESPSSGSGSVSGVAGGVRYRLAPSAPGVPYGILAWTPAGDRAGGLGLAAVALAVIVVCAVLLALVTTRLTRPLLALTRTAARLLQGDLSARSGAPATAPTRGRDEVTTLAAAFDVLAGRLEGSEEELQASREALAESLTRFSVALERTHDLEGLLQTVLDAARDAADAGIGSALLGDPRTLEERAASVREGVAASPVVVDILARLARRAVERGETVRSAQPVPAIAVPLRGGNRLVGALAMAREAGAPAIDDASAHAVEALAEPAGVAVVNSLDHEETRRLSVTDALTGAGNFRHLSTTLAREVERATRFNRPLSVVMLDLDHFKTVNDTHGHVFGDAVLREFARRLQDCLREVDTVARYGGEEFTVVLPETGSDGAGAVAARIVQAIRSQPFTVGALSAEVTVSAGVASFPDHGRTASEILRAADSALYVAKSAGRDRWCLAEVVLPGQESELPLEGQLPSPSQGRAG
jgi:two-component system, cell cycle response regulator